MKAALLVGFVIPAVIAASPGAPVTQIDDGQVQAPPPSPPPPAPPAPPAPPVVTVTSTVTVACPSGYPPLAVTPPPALAPAHPPPPPYHPPPPPPPAPISQIPDGQLQAPSPK